MSIINKLLTKIKTMPKHIVLIVLAVIVLATAISVPTLARYKNRLDIESILSKTENWDGTIATSYHKGSGSSSDPYIISNAKEFAYFKEQLKSTDYEGIYFKLSNDIIINNGTFTYDETNKITYTLNQSTFYIKEYTTDFYDNTERSGTKIASINSFSSLNNFKGHLDGDYHRIYGLYITSDTESNLALFKNVKGTIENLYLENSMIYGGNTTALLASTTTNATIKNVLTNGNVVSTNTSGEDKITLSIPDKEITKTTLELTDSLTVDIPASISSSTIKSVTLKGKYQSTVEGQEILINDTKITQSDFEIDLNKTLLEEIKVEVADTTESAITLTNLTYEVVYEYDITAGVIAKAENTTISNVINKTNIFGQTEAAGIIGTMTNTTLSNSYNIGNITATTNVSGITSRIISSAKDITISNVYNSGTLTAQTTNSFVKEISNNQKVSIENSFNTTTSTYAISTVEDEVVLSNVLDVTTTTIASGTTTNSVTKIDSETLKTKDYMTNNLSFNEFVDNTDLAKNSDNVWVYEKNSLPILYIDDLNNPIAALHVGTYTWNDLSYELSEIRFSSEPAFSIEGLDNLVPLEETYYYIHNSKTPLTRSEIEAITDWTLYENIENLTGEGNYIIYVKAIDQDGYTSYLNSECLVVDLTAPEVSLKMNDKTWNSLKTELKTINIAEETTLIVEATDEYSPITNQSYYISDTLMSEDELKQLDSSSWTEYKDNIKVSTKGVYVINVKVTDEANHVTYINSDYIAFSGYEEKVTVGRNKKSVEEINITDKSIVSYDFTYQNNITYQEGYKNNLITNILLPKGTSITLINNETNERYYYTITTNTDDYNYETSCETTDCEKYATYPLSLFKKMGQSTITFDDEKYLDNKTKDLTLLIDFKNANIDNDLSLETKLELTDSTNEVILSTLKDTIKKINIYNDLAYNLTITKVNEPQTINYNSDSETTLEIKINVTDPIVDNNTVIDTTIENKKLGIIIKLVDSANNIISKEYLKSIEFKIGDNYYSPNSDGITRIKLSDTATTKSTTISIVTHESNINLAEGTYNFVVTPFISVDGKYSSTLSTNSITTALTTKDTSKKEYSFNVLGNNSDKIISKKIATTTMRFNIVNTLNNSSVRVSLYKRNNLNPEDQTYDLIDLKEYTTTELDKVDGIENVYSVEKGEFNLSFNTTKFDYTGYELRFELYDGSNKLTTIKKKFIVR